MDAEHDDQGAGHALLLPFDTDSADFARGFEAGLLWARLQMSDNWPVEGVVHASNTEMVLRMAEATNRRVRGAPLDEVWTEVTFEA